MKYPGKYQAFLGPALCVAGGILLYLILMWTGAGDDKAAGSGALIRGDYGQKAEEYHLRVEGLTDREIPLSVSVNARVYTEEQAREVFYDVMDGMEELILGENGSLQNIKSDLDLPARIDDRGVKISWSSSDVSVMDDTGKLMEEVSQPEEVILTAILSTEAVSEEGEVKTFREQFEIPLKVLPPDRTADEQILQKFLARIEGDEKNGRTADEFLLPSEFEGRKLSYHSEGGNDYRFIPLLGILLAALIIAHEKNKDSEDKKKRDRQLSLDYSDMLSKFVVLTGAGLTVRNVWEKMVRDYEEAKNQKKLEERAVYEEMKQTAIQMQNGVSEQEAYRNFGRRCGLSPYLKFSSLLEQNCRSGTKNLKEILQNEMNDALEERKNLARRLGEEAGTKLLLPLFMLLGIVMAIIMVPALLMM